MICYRPALLFAASFLLVFSSYSTAQDVSDPQKLDPPPAKSNFMQLGEMANAASDLRKAGEAFDSFGKALNKTAESIATSMAIMSSEFDPFGYKTAFKTLGRQSEIIQQQQELIQLLQQREIERLQHENMQLQLELKKRMESERPK